MVAGWMRMATSTWRWERGNGLISTYGETREESPMPDRPGLSFTQLQAAMQAMIEKAMQLPEEPVAMAIVDATGQLMWPTTPWIISGCSRRHALRKAYTAAILGMDRGSRPAAAQPGAQHQRDGRPPAHVRPGRPGHHQGWRFWAAWVWEAIPAASAMRIWHAWA